MLSNVVLSKTPPRLILFNVSEVALNDAAWEEGRAAYLQALASPSSLDTWRKTQGRAVWFETLSGLYRLRHRLRLTVEERWPNYLRHRETYDWGGFRWFGQMDDDVRNEQLAAYRDKFLINFSTDGRQGEYFDKLLALSKEQDIYLIVVITPVTPEFLSAFPTSEDAISFKDFVLETATSYGIPVADYYQTDQLTETSFFDLHHTNADGTVSFSRMVSQNVLAPAFRQMSFLPTKLDQQ